MFYNVVMDNTFLDFEFVRYTKIIKSYLDELADKKAVEICHAWLDKLSTCASRAHRNAYVLKLLYQLSRGSLQEPFTKDPTSEELLIPDEVDSNSNLESLALDQDASSLAAGDKTPEAPDKSRETFIVSKEHPTVKVKRNSLLNIKTNNSTIENRVQNLVIKLRHMKRENAILHQLLGVKEEHLKNHSDNFSESIKQASTKLCPQLEHISDLRSNLNDPNNVLKSDQDHLNEMNEIKIKCVVTKQNLDLFKLKNGSELEIVKLYESKMFELTKQHSNSLDELRRYYENVSYQLKIAYDAKIIEKEGLIKSKEEELARLKERIEELQARPFKTFSMHKIEQRLNKIETSTSIYLKNYQKKILKQRQKYINDCTMLLKLLQQKSNVTTTDDVKVDDTRPNPFKKLEDKYKNIVAKVQAAALKRMIQDQVAMETLDKRISRMSHVCFKSSQMNNVHNKIKTNSEIEDPSREPNGVEVINPDQEQPTDKP